MSQSASSSEALADISDDTAITSLPDGLADVSLDQFEQEIEERQHIIEACPIDIYVSSINRRYAYPFRLNSYTTGRPGVARSSETMMIDSGWAQVGEMGKILDEAVRLDADVVIGEDHTPACDGYDAMDPLLNAEEAWECISVYEGHDWDGDLLLPVHPNEHPDEAIDVETFAYELDELQRYDPGHIPEDAYDDPHFDTPSTETERLMYEAGRANFSFTYNLIGKYGGVAVGGLRALDVDERIEALKTIDERVAPDVHVHALAPGTEPEMLRFLKDNPDVIDSLDMSTPETAPSNNKMPDRTWSQDRFLFPTGTDSTTIRAIASLLNVLTLNYMLSPLCDDSAIGRDEGELSCPQCDYTTHRKSYNVCPKHGCDLE